MRVAIYTRAPAEVDEEHRAFFRGMQEYGCHQLIDKMGAEVNTSLIFSETVIADRVEDRPKLQLLLECVRQGQVECVTVFQPSVLDEDPATQNLVEHHLDEHGCILFTVQEAVEMIAQRDVGVGRTIA